MSVHEDAAVVHVRCVEHTKHLLLTTRMRSSVAGREMRMQVLGSGRKHSHPSFPIQTQLQVPKLNSSTPSAKFLYSSFCFLHLESDLDFLSDMLKFNLSCGHPDELAKCFWVHNGQANGIQRCNFQVSFPRTKLRGHWRCNDLRSPLNFDLILCKSSK